MIVYRIVVEKYANELKASGRSGRWNLSEEYVIYTASTRSLATLELLVNRSGIHPSSSYKVMLLDIPDEVQKYIPQQLPDDWRGFDAYPMLQNIGSGWYKAEESLVLAVPSAVIPQEFNFLINTRHNDFGNHIELVGVEDYFWDERL